MCSCALQVLVSKYNALSDDRYYDVESQSSFAFDHLTQVAPNHVVFGRRKAYPIQKASAVRSYSVESQHKPLM
jgi:capping protein alpha